MSTLNDRDLCRLEALQFDFELHRCRAAGRGRCTALPRWSWYCACRWWPCWSRSRSRPGQRRRTCPSPVPVIPPCVCARPVTTHGASRITTVRRRATERDLCLMFFSKSLASILDELIQPSAVRACSSISGLRASVTERLHHEDGSFFRCARRPQHPVHSTARCVCLRNAATGLSNRIPIGPFDGVA